MAKCRKGIGRTGQAVIHVSLIHQIRDLVMAENWKMLDFSLFYRTLTELGYQRYLSFVFQVQPNTSHCQLTNWLTT